MKHEFFSTELVYIENNDIRKFAEVAIDLLPDYFFETAASSTGKYHPAYALGAGGLVRHTKAAARFAHHLFQLEQYHNEFSSREMDCVIAALLLHDGWKHGSGNSTYTVHEHPQVCADWVMSEEKLKLLPEEELKLIAGAISSHMGQWNESKKSKIVLHKPVTRIQQIVHLCDYFASRKDLEVQFDDAEGPATPDINTFTIPFGKYKGELLVDVAKSHKDYLEWMRKNLDMREPLKTFVSTILKGE